MAKTFVEITAYIVCDTWTSKTSHYVLDGISNVNYDVSAELVGGKPQKFDSELHTVYIEVETLNVVTPIFVRESMGHRFDRGSVFIGGKLLDEKPEQFVTFANLMQPYSGEPPMIDHTKGRGTIWQQMAQDDPARLGENTTLDEGFRMG
jgi:hypothetical protein